MRRESARALKLEAMRVPGAAQRERKGVYARLSRAMAVRCRPGTLPKAVSLTIHASRVYPTCAYVSADLG